MPFDPKSYAAGSTKPKKSGGFDPSAYASGSNEPPAEPQPGLLERAGRGALNAAVYVGEKIDKYGGAPTRAAIDKALTGGGVGDALSTGWEQFGSDPKLASTGRDIARHAGVPDKDYDVPSPFPGVGNVQVNPASVAGLGVDVAADPTILVPFGKIASTVARTGARSAKAIGGAVAVGGRAAEAAGTKAVTKVGSLMTGVPEQEIATYINRYPEVQKMIAEHGDDIQGAADKVREGYQAAVRSMRKSLGEEVGSAIEALPKDSAVDIAPVLDELEKVKGRMNKTLRFEEVKQVDDLIDRIKSLSAKSAAPEAAARARGAAAGEIRIADGEVGSLTGKGNEYLRDPKTGEVMAEFMDGHMVPIGSSSGKVKLSKELEEAGTLVTPGEVAASNPSGKITPKEMYEVKQFLQDRGAKSFMKDGQIFTPGRDPQLAAKNASRAARKIVNTMSPTVAEANQKLSLLHTAEEKINPNLLAAGKSDAALAGAGSGTNRKAVKELEFLGELTGTDMLGEAEKFAAAKRFASPGLTATDTTGKPVERMAKAGLVGLGLGGFPGAAIAASLTSPLALKTAIQVGRIPVQAIKKLVGTTGTLTDDAIQRAYQALKTPEGQRAFDTSVRAFRIKSIGGETLPRFAETDQDREVASEPLKGEAKWAADGAKKLGMDNEAMKRVMSSKEGKNLLIEASDLEPGNKRFERIRARLKERGGQ